LLIGCIDSFDIGEAEEEVSLICIEWGEQYVDHEAWWIIKRKRHKDLQKPD